MGMYLNPGSGLFEEALNSEIYVDKTEMVNYVNSVVCTKQKYMCVSRPRRFGKTMATEMLSTYYDRTANSRELFERCKLSKSGESWDKYLGKFDVIRLVMTDFLTGMKSVEDMLTFLSEEVSLELKDTYSNIHFGSQNDLRLIMGKIYSSTKTRFVVFIDEWDAVFREFKYDKDGQRTYLDFLRMWLKDKEYLALAYMTGILPIKKYGKHTALNMFDEYSIIMPMQLAEYTGFTTEEVRQLCDVYGRDFQKIKEWYDGYKVSNNIPADPNYALAAETGKAPTAEKYSLYNPLSVVKAVRNGIIDNFWNQTETFEALRQYIDWDFDELKEEVAILMEGGRVKVDITGYQNDMTSFETKDDILTMLIHLGYLGYDNQTKELFVPNQEVLQVFKTSTKSRAWAITFRALENSRKLLEATWAGDEETVAELIEDAHDKAGNKTYHTEAGLSYAVQLAYYAAQDYYTVIPELDSGKGYADLVYLPKTPDIPAIMIELKYDENARSVITQIHRQRYPDRLEHYKGNLILIGINYDRTVSNDSPSFKHHSCTIERA